MNQKLLIGSLAGLGAVVLAAILALPLLVPTASLRGEIERRVGDATGRAFRINGPFAFSVFPSLGFDARGVTLANVRGGRARAIVEVDEMRIAVKLWPLLSGRIEAREIVLERPRIALEVAADGSANWELVRVHTEASGLRLPSGTRFAGVTIRDGRVSYDNARLDIHRAIEGLDAKIAITQLGMPVGVTGAFTLRGRRLAFTSTVGTVQTLLAGQATQVDASFSADFVHAGFLGFVSSDGTVKGTFSLRAPSLKDLAAWLGHPVSAGSGLGPVSALGAIAAKDRRIVLTNIQAKLDAMKILGALTADTSARVPLVAASLAIDQLDLNTYLQLGGAGARHGPPSGGWGKTAVALDLVKLVNGHLTLEVGTLRLLHLHTGNTTLAIALQDGLMTAHLGPLQLYGGSGEADLGVDARGPVPVLTNKLRFAGIAMAEFLGDTIGVDKLAGSGTIVLDVTARGASPDAIMRSLSGKGAVTIARGGIHGVDLGQVARTVQTLLSAGATGQGATTPFDRFGGSFSVSDGILWNGDLKLDSTFLHMTGQGHLDLGNQTIAYRIVPKASLGGRLNLLDVGMPFAVTGTWSHLHYVPDLAGAVTGLVGSVLDKGAAPISGLLNGLAGGGPAKKKNKGVGDTLKGIFGLH